MHSENELTLWLNRLGEEPEEAMRRIWEAYYLKLVSYARAKLGNLPRRSADEEDVAISAIHSFFRAANAQRFPDLNDREDLWKLLLTITARKAHNETRSQNTLRRGGGTVRGESVFGNTDSENVGMNLAAEPSAEFGELLVDEFTNGLDQLGDPRLREIAVLKLEGYSNQEISENLKCSQRSVERKLARIRAEWSGYDS